MKKTGNILLNTFICYNGFIEIEKQIKMTPVDTKACTLKCVSYQFDFNVIECSTSTTVN